MPDSLFKQRTRVPVTEAWRDELAAFTKSLLQDNEALQKELSADQRAEEDKRPRSTMYSPETGRLIPPPSRAMSRGASRRGRGNQQFVTGSLQHISADPDLENIVMVMLCQILQTDDLNAVQAWLCSAGPREKELVMGLVKTAIAGKDEYYKQYPAEYITDNGREKLPPINGKSSGEVNRTNHKTNYISEIQEASQPVKPASPVLRRSKTTLQPAMLQPRQEKSFSAKEKTDSTKKQNQAPKLQLKYSKAQPTDKKEPMWSQNQSLNTF
uniref:Protein TBATA n=1 Tax=Biomphalaria glabrata TaxID=6526 RepID=A0A2C9LW82_BIOGL